MTTKLIRFTQRGNPAADDSYWEPDGVTLQVRFCEGGGTYRLAEIPTATLPPCIPIAGLTPRLRCCNTWSCRWHDMAIDRRPTFS